MLTFLAILMQGAREEHTRRSLAYKELAEFGGKHARQSSTGSHRQANTPGIRRQGRWRKHPIRYYHARHENKIFSYGITHDLRSAHIEIGTFLVSEERKDIHLPSWAA